MGLREALLAVMDGQDRFGHRQHVHLAWIALKTRPEAAGPLLSDWLREIAAAHGQPERFHQTRTTAWTEVTRRHLNADDGGDFDDFVERSPRLLDSRLLDHHWSRSALDSAAARTAWMEPDLRPLPAVISNG
jgi:hypothetical protein